MPPFSPSNPSPPPCVHLWFPSLLRPILELNENWCSNNHHSHPVICWTLPSFLSSPFFHFMTSQLELTCVCLSVCPFCWLRVYCVTSSFDYKIKCKKKFKKNNWYLANVIEDFNKIQSCNIIKLVSWQRSKSIKKLSFETYLSIWVKCLFSIGYIIIREV